ncbi:Transmembrane secretion effector [Rhizobium lusitanum]|nr:Transmembrane secretion effector [Rhizobium lusitanum]
MLTLSVAFDETDPWIILGFSFQAGCGIALHDPAWQASVGDIVERPHLPGAVTLISVGFNTVRSVGPALGGIVVASARPLSAFAIATFGFAVPLITLWQNKWKTLSSSLPREAMFTAICDGLRFTAMSSEIKGTVAQSHSLSVAFGCSTGWLSARPKSSGSIPKGTGSFENAQGRNHKHDDPRSRNCRASRRRGYARFQFGCGRPWPLARRLSPQLSVVCKKRRRLPSSPSSTSAVCKTSVRIGK